MTRADVGIVIIGRNEGERLIACLASVAGGYAVVYVDSGSTDGSVAAARNAGATVVELDHAQPFTAARARNAGLEALTRVAPGIRFVQFVDGDCTVDAGWIELAARFLLARSDVAVVCGRRRERFPAASLYNTLADVEWDTPVGEAAACGGDALIRVEAFRVVGGYCAALIAGEEPEFCLRLREKGWKVWRVDAEMTLHDMAMTRFPQWWRRGVRAGFGMTEVWWKHRRSPVRIWAREIASMAIWGGALPLLVLTIAAVSPAFLLILLVYPVQVARIALRNGARSAISWWFAVFATLAKFAGFAGSCRFAINRLHSRRTQLIEYR